MFSSLPGASKIYVQSSKTKQKNVSSAKKKRKKSASICTPVHIHDEETLVSSTSLQNCSTSQSSLNNNEESFKNEIDYESDKEIINDEVTDFEKNMESFRNNDNINDLCIDEMNEDVHSSYLISVKSQNMNDTEEEKSIMEENTGHLINVTADSIYCDEIAALNNQITKTTQTDSCVQNSLTNLQVSDPISHKDQNDDSNKQIMNHGEASPSISQEVQGVLENEKSVLIIEKDKENSSRINPTKDASCEDWQSENNDVTTFPSENIIYENTEALSNDCYVLKQSKDTLKVTSDMDSGSSVQSDCCQSSNIYDIHIINSEHSSIDENQTFSGEDCRVQSPEQSEKSCTESTLYDSKSICQNESSNLVTENFSKKNIALLTQDNFSNSKGISQNVSNSSCNFTDFYKRKTSDIIRRSLSLPSKLNDFESIRLIENRISQDAFTISNYSNEPTNNNKFCYMSDKSTFTSDETISKSTATSDTIGAYFSKKDVATTPLIKENRKTFTENKSVATASLKDSTMLIMKVMPPIAVMQARARSYVFGSIGPTRSLLGNEELSRFFPDNKVTIFVGTWNMNGHDPPEIIDDFLLPFDISSVPDIYAIGIQESMQSRSEWEIMLQTTLGPSHVLFASTSFGVLHLSIFMRRDLIWFCSEPEEANIATRPGSMIKTKGAVAICFLFFGTSFLFVNSHLTAHEQKLRERLSDYEKICSSLDLPKQIHLKPHQKNKDVTSRFDCTFWCGDLNFRVVQDRPSVVSFVEDKIRRHSSCNSLMEHDQLTQAMSKGTAFHGFSEGVINFIPSYKFDVGTSFFDSTKQRVPSYTDRILYRCRNKSSIICTHYNTVPEMLTSDHKPVYGVFEVSIKPGRDNIPLSGGLFKREIYLEAIRRRAQQLEVTRNHKQSTICSIM